MNDKNDPNDGKPQRQTERHVNMNVPSSDEGSVEADKAMAMNTTHRPRPQLLSRKSSAALLMCRQASTKRLTRGLSKRQMSKASILLSSVTLDEESMLGGNEDLLPFLADNPAPDIAYSKIPVPDHVLRKIFVVLYFTQLALSIVFLRWLTGDGWNKKSPATSAIFLSTELIALISTNLFLFNGLLAIFPEHKDQNKSKNDKPLADETQRETQRETQSDTGEYEDVTEILEVVPTVAVCVCRYKEPIDDLILTVHSMDRLRWPAAKLQLYILDDGWSVQERPYLRDQAVALRDICGVPPVSSRGPPKLQQTEQVYRPDCATECGYWDIREASRTSPSVTLVARTKPDVSHYKAGNLNNFLYNYLGDAAKRGEPVPQYMVMLDHDMLPHPDFVKDAVSRLKPDPCKAFVQYPQRFYDVIGSDLLYAGNEIFFDGVQINRGHVGLAAFAGTNAMWNLQPLYHVGGFQYGSLTEDANTGLAVNLAGYTSAYSTRELAVGQSPQTVENAMQQRMRWSQGAIEMLVHHTKSLLTCRSPFANIALPEDLRRNFTVDPPQRPRCGKRLIMGLIFFDSMVYPLYSMGFLLHALVCAMYLFNAEAPIAPADPTQVLYYWLPLYIVRAACQVLAFPGVSLATQWNSQKAWAGYSLSTLASIRKGLFCGGGWFNTGAVKKDRFWLQYGNTLVALIIYAMIFYRAIAFIVIDNTCTAWMTTGALLYGMVMLAHVGGWAIEPFRRVESSAEDDSLAVLRDSLRNQTQSNSFSQGDSTRSLKIQEKAMRQSQRNREEFQSFDLSLLFIFIHVILLSFLLFFWASGNCDAGLQSLPTADPNGYCNFKGCNGFAHGGAHCNSGEQNCFECFGEWCPGNVTIEKGTATTTRYWDCSGGSCGCGFSSNVTGDPLHCASNAPFLAPEGNPYGASFYGAAAISQALGGGEWMSEGCGNCWKVTATSNIASLPEITSTMVLKGTNYCPPINDACNGTAHFDIAVPGFDFTRNSFANVCAERIPEEEEGLSACEFWMHNTTDPSINCNCFLLKDPVLRSGCLNFLSLSWDNPKVEYEVVDCPPELTSLPCWEENGEVWPLEAPGLCADPFFVESN